MDFPYPIYRVPGAQALDKLAELRGQGGGIALILGSAEDFENLCEGFEFNEDTPESYLAQAEKLDAVHWLRHRYDEEGKADVDEAEMDAQGDADEPWPTSPHEASQRGLSAHCDVLSNEPYDEVVLTVLPTDASWKAPCLLKTGGWNECPFPHEQAAVFKLWVERHGAELACVANDVVEMTVARPPTTRKAALELAQQQYSFCGDIVDQGVGDVQTLAKTLLFAPVWYFWWD
ncbi:DUF4253 domain-containing protein [Ottowia testudinis]|uniref:DUF4253 domain-containing protein n=1 Tax=Ottowia testudinis TaxID=2816950 RepID=A0A975H251_9BURK|nr:DUF4253 domain-containing protein [Ottowia testudinis]QTD43800.1 DUF4253 domain-containing protein [Ottowia testudinis]